MSLFTDILKGLPENAVLRSKVADAETRYAALETENAILKDDLHDANTQITKLKKQIEELTHKDDLNEVELMLLQSVSQDQDVNIVSIARNLKIDQARVQYHIQRLIDSGYVVFKGFAFEGIYLIQQKGREALMNRDLI